jgi:hypothetical protein
MEFITAINVTTQEKYQPETQVRLIDMKDFLSVFCK